MTKFGSLRKLPSGKFQARYTGPDGLRHKAPDTFYQRGDAENWLDDEEFLIRKGKWTPPAERQKAEAAKARSNALTVRVWLDRWLEEKRQEGLAESTLTKYKDRIERRVTGEQVPGDFADKPVAEITTADVREWWEQITAVWPKSGEMNRKTYRHLRSAFGYLVEDEVIPTNPIFIRASKRKVQPKYDKVLLSYEELKSLYEQAAERYKVVTALTFFHGLRIGEAIALRRKNILVTYNEDGTTNISVRVEDNFQRINGEMVSMGRTKTAAGTRTVPIFSAFHADILTHLKKFTGPNDEDLVTTTRTGNPLMDTSYRTMVAGMKDRAGIEKRVNPHVGRRVITTALLEQGVEATVVGGIIGDKDLTTVLEVYADIRDGRTDEVMKELGKKITL